MFCGTVRILWYKRVSLQQRYVVPCSMDLLTCCSMDLESRDKDIGALCVCLSFTARLLEACLHSLLSFLTSNFPSNPLLPDSLFSIERLSLRFYEPPISTEEQVRPLRVFMRPCRLKSEGRRTPRRPARGPQDAQREDPTTPSARTPRRPARGPQDAQREDPSRTPRRPARGPQDEHRATRLD
ncbi:hypothetical protein I79_018084 [Cricetulus griseus]|uniref:Uncharacterized protein n=1 Tax=Cricetulus griseus TaxID=10029 RepID=G3I3S3_CRIGR|nr:hypothetical protein I79_018084 [Cricetulus griseus]